MYCAHNAYRNAGDINGIAFNHPALLQGEAGAEVRMVYKLDVNEYRNVREHQLLVEHIECV